MSLTDLFRSMRDRLQPQKTVPASQVLPRMRESSGPFPALRTAAPSASAGEPAGAEEQPPVAAAPAIPPPNWADVFPAHYRALDADLARRGENLANWEMRDGRDLGVSERGHTVAFVLHKKGTSATIQVELTLFKGSLASIRVR